MEQQQEAVSSPASEASAAPVTTIQQYAAFPFATDREYQQGLASILLGWSLDHEPTAETREEMLRRTRVFYFIKTTGISITMEEAREYERGLKPHTGELIPPTSSQSPQSNGSEPEEIARVLSFAELKELIESGRVDQIPNNKIIPEKLSEDPPSQSTASVRKKPWEMAQVEAQLS